MFLYFKSFTKFKPNVGGNRFQSSPLKFFQSKILKETTLGLKSLNKNKEKPDTSAEAVNIACLLVHAAKIDENYTSDEKEIIKKTVKKLYPDLDNLNDVITQAEQKENDSNHIQEFTKNVKSLTTENKILIVETLWRIILSDGK